MHPPRGKKLHTPTSPLRKNVGFVRLWRRNFQQPKRTKKNKTAELVGSAFLILAAFVFSKSSVSFRARFHQCGFVGTWSFLSAHTPVKYSIGFSWFLSLAGFYNCLCIITCSTKVTSIIPRYLPFIFYPRKLNANDHSSQQR